jgi:hypothetical protein
MNVPAQEPARMDEFLPVYEVSAAYEIRIHAPALVVYQCLLRCDFNQLWIVRTLMSLRSGKRLPRKRVPGDLFQRLQGTGFVMLDDVPGEEVVIGVAGKFWRPDGGRCLELTAGDFSGFARPGYTKAAWNFRFKAEASNCTVLSTETRVQCFGRAALWKFRAYWSLVGPFSGWIREAILKQVKIEAESGGRSLGLEA